MSKIKIWQWFGGAALVLMTAMALGLGRAAIVGLRQPVLPPARPAAEFAPAAGETAAGETPGVFLSTPGVKEAAVHGVNIAVPFTPQAPFADWEQPYQDACEEAALLMAQRSLLGETLSAEEARAEILQMVDWQQKKFGFYKDSTIAETVRLAEGYFPQVSAKPVYDITADDIRREVAAGRPVVVLLDGRLVGNPYYTAPGPDKHALVIKGFTGDSFITNDPGTKRGADFVYAADTLMSALIDYDGETPGTGTRAMIVLSLASPQR